jgi:hypothetical protein
MAGHADNECIHGYLLSTPAVETRCPTCLKTGGGFKYKAKYDAAMRQDATGHHAWSINDCKHGIRTTLICGQCLRDKEEEEAKRTEMHTMPVFLDEYADQDEIDLVNNPLHYQSGGMEAIDVIEAFQLPYHIGSAVKYLLRAGKKDNRLMDLQKAAWYINREIDRESDRLAEELLNG